MVIDAWCTDDALGFHKQETVSYIKTDFFFLRGGGATQKLHELC